MADCLLKHRQPVYGWFFSGADCADDGQDIFPGETLLLRPDQEKYLERHGTNDEGLFACRTIVDCLTQAQGLSIWRMRLEGTVLEFPKYSLATRRTALWGIDGRDVLEVFARTCTQDVLRVIPVPLQGIVRRCLVEGADKADTQRALDRVTPILDRMLPDVCIVNDGLMPDFSLFENDARFSHPWIMAHLAIFSTLQTSLLAKTWEKLVADWAAVALVMRLKILTATSGAASMRDEYVRQHDIANRELEQDVWRAAFERGLKFPDPECLPWRNPV